MYLVTKQDNPGLTWIVYRLKQNLQVVKLSEKKKNILEKIDSPENLKQLSPQERIQLAAEIRTELIEVISKNGGHLAPNMGAVELTIAIHTVFNAPLDKIVWDVGHQAYVHKLLTGRRELFKTLRQDGGCSGFLSRNESEYDVFGAGHAGTAISAALGMAAARDIRGGTENVVAIVGDGSLNCGISLEGLNNVSEITDNMIIVINDNKMSISPNVGAMARYLNRVISARPYNSFKAFARKIVRSIPLVGDDITHKIARLEEAAKSMFVPGVIFEELDLRYIGPVDGHNIEEMIRTFDVIKDFRKPTVIHVLTEKGRGYQPAESAPEKFHGLSPFDPDTGITNTASSDDTFSSLFGKALCELAGENDDIVAITAAMQAGTGLTEFAEKFPGRFYDVGIAEEHALVFAAGLATEGIRPVVAIYSTFLQRALDYLFHDIALQKLPVIICTDRSGIVDDGPTHHGINDLAFLLSVPGLIIMSPCNGCELRSMLYAAYDYKAPAIIRYPRGSAALKAVSDKNKSDKSKITPGRAEIVRKGTDIAIWSAGRELATAIQVADILKKQKISAAVINSRFLKPFDSGLLIKQAGKMFIVTIEDCRINGGLGSVTDNILVNIQHNGIKHFGWNDEIIPHGTVSGIRRKYGMTPEIIADEIVSSFNARKKTGE